MNPCERTYGIACGENGYEDAHSRLIFLSKYGTATGDREIGRCNRRPWDRSLQPATVGSVAATGDRRRSLRDSSCPIGVAEYQLTGVLPEDLQTSLPSIEAIEQAMQRSED